MQSVSSGKLTSYFFVNCDKMEGLAADGTAVCLFAPFPQTAVMQRVATNWYRGNVIVIERCRRVLFVYMGECVGVLNGETFVLTFEFFDELMHCRAQRGCVGFDVQGLQTDNALVSHGGSRTEPKSDFQANTNAEDACKLFRRFEF